MKFSYRVDKSQRSISKLFYFVLLGLSFFFVACNEKDNWAGTIEGTVVDYESGEPVGEVTLTFVPGGYTTVTQADGSFSIGDLPAAVYAVQAAKTGFVRSENEVVVSTASFQKITLKIINDRTEFPVSDPNFKKYLLENFDTNGDGILTFGEVVAITRIDCINRNIESMSEIRYMYDLEVLKCDSNFLLQELNISKNRKLDTIGCGYTRLLALDVSKADSLRSLEFSATRIAKIDLTKNIALQFLSCVNNLKIEKLDFSKNTRMQNIVCSGSAVASIEVSKCTLLENLACDSALVTSLSLSRNKLLKNLSCSKTSISSLTISADSSLQRLNCSQTEIYRLDISKNKELVELDCGYTRLKTLDVSENEKLKLLNVTGIPYTDGKLKITVTPAQQSGLTITGDDNYELVVKEETPDESA